MSQHDFNIANQTSAAARTDINSALAALATLSSGATAPSTTYANMLWYDTANDVLKIRNEADSNWINVGYLDQGSNAFRILDDTQVMNTGGTQTGLLGDQATATWEAGTGTTESLISPAKVKAAIVATAPGTTWLSPVAVTGGDSFNFSGIPSDVAMIYLGINNVSLTTNDNILIRLGTSSGIESSGYVSWSEWNGSNFDGGLFGAYAIRLSDNRREASGLLTLARMDASANTWVASGNFAQNGTVAITGGVKSLGGPVSQLQIFRSGTTGTFDTGVVAVGYSK
jgi:hypothetical protein